MAKSFYQSLLSEFWFKTSGGHLVLEPFWKKFAEWPHGRFIPHPSVIMALIALLRLRQHLGEESFSRWWISESTFKGVVMVRSRWPSLRSHPRLLAFGKSHLLGGSPPLQEKGMLDIHCEIFILCSGRRTSSPSVELWPDPWRGTYQVFVLFCFSLLFSLV